MPRLLGASIRLTGSNSPLASFGISAVICVTAGLSDADDTGRRYLIGVAAAVQLAIFPAWLGATVIVGLSPANVVETRLLSFAVKLVTISATAVLAYATLLRRTGGWRASRGGR